MSRGTEKENSAKPDDQIIQDIWGMWWEGKCSSDTRAE